MSSCHHAYRRIASFAFVLTAVLVASSVLMNAEDETPPKVEWFFGYQWLNPGGNVPDQNTPPNAFKLPSINSGAGTSLAYNFTKYLALEGNYGVNWNRFGDVNSLTLGPKLAFRGEGVNFFLHTLLGYERVGARTHGTFHSNGIGALLGGGMDLKLWKPLSLRLFEADYQWGHENFASIVPIDNASLRRPSFDGVRLSTGPVFNFGGAPEVPPTATCSIDHSEVMVGEPLHVTVSPSNFNPKHTLKYDWSSTGGKIEGKETGATIDTAGAAPGSYTATARVSDPKKKGGEASCTSNFTVKPLNPPQISCSASPATVEVGTPATITCTCTSPDNATVTVGNWTSSAGSIAGSGNSATLSTSSVSAGPATVNVTCTDSRGLTASTSTTVTVNNPPPPPPVVNKELEARLALHSVYFPTAKPPVNDPNAGLVPSQEQTLITLATDFKKYLEAKPDAHLILEGHADVRGSVPYNQALSERRVARVKSSLVEHGVPEANIETKALGAQHNLTAAEVKASVEQNPELTKEERARVLRNMKTIIWASNRRVDITLSTAGRTETSVRQYPFNATDSLTLIGGREAVRKAPAAKRAAKKPAKKQ
jgi:outer membrane protein OmpA-like peptidoglycan-associated protein